MGFKVALAAMAAMGRDRHRQCRHRGNRRQRNREGTQCVFDERVDRAGEKGTLPAKGIMFFRHDRSVEARRGCRDRFAPVDIADLRQSAARRAVHHVQSIGRSGLARAPAAKRRTRTAPSGLRTPISTGSRGGMASPIVTLRSTKSDRCHCLDHIQHRNEIAEVPPAGNRHQRAASNPGMKGRAASRREKATPVSVPNPGAPLVTRS